MHPFSLPFRERFKSTSLSSSPLEKCLPFPPHPLLFYKKRLKSATPPVNLLGWLPLLLSCRSFRTSSTSISSYFLLGRPRHFCSFDPARCASSRIVRCCLIPSLGACGAVVLRTTQALLPSRGARAEAKLHPTRRLAGAGRVARPLASALVPQARAAEPLELPVLGCFFPCSPPPFHLPSQTAEAVVSRAGFVGGGLLIGGSLILP